MFSILLAQRGAIEDDPIVLAEKDPAGSAEATGIVLVAVAAV
jgi:hypothetical protein